MAFTRSHIIDRTRAGRAEGGMVFPKFAIEEIKKREGRDLTRFDLDFDLPDQFLPERREASTLRVVPLR
jgi:cytochrome c peroxidase